MSDEVTKSEPPLMLRKAVALTIDELMQEPPPAILEADILREFGPRLWQLRDRGYTPADLAQRYIEKISGGSVRTNKKVFTIFRRLFEALDNGNFRPRSAQGTGTAAGRVDRRDEDEVPSGANSSGDEKGGSVVERRDGNGERNEADGVGEREPGDGAAPQDGEPEPPQHVPFDPDVPEEPPEDPDGGVGAANAPRAPGYGEER